MASPANSIPDTSLGLSYDEIALLRQHQRVALQQAPAVSSRAASAASSQGLLLLDNNSLQALSHHFDRLMGAIQNRLAQADLTRGNQLTQQTQMTTSAQSANAERAMAIADAEIARFHAILRQIDELEREFDKVRHIRDIVKSFRGRVERVSRRL